MEQPAPIHSSQTLTNLIRNRLNPNSTRSIRSLIQSRLSSTQLIPSLSTQILTNLIRNRLNLTQKGRTQQTRLRHSQYLPSKQTDKRMRGLRAPKEAVNEGPSSTHLLNRPALTPIVRGGKSARVHCDYCAHTTPVGAYASFCLAASG